MRKRSSRKTLKPRIVKDDTLETLILVKHFFWLLDIAFGETKCANLTNSIQGKIEDLTLGFDASFRFQFFFSNFEDYRGVVPGGAGVPWHPQILADQLTLSQPRGVYYAHKIILAPPDFQTFRRPCYAKACKKFETFLCRESWYDQNSYECTVFLWVQINNQFTSR